MCGINGLVDFQRNYSVQAKREMVHRMNESILHRGPDAEGVFDSDTVTMGMRRLAVLDLNTGDQPIYNEERTVCVVFNGEIYNFSELREKLQKKNHVFCTGTDTEVIAHGYEEYGVGLFEKLDGMFAIALYDIREEKLFLVRDRMGEKPLYYHRGEHILLFGSELQGLSGTGLLRRELDPAALNLYLQLTYIPAPLCIYKNVYKVLPGHYLEVKTDGRMEDHTYWELLSCFADAESELSYSEAKEKLFSAVDESVRKRMVSDVPLGAFLSGGVDSGVMVGLMTRHSKQPVHTFTIGFHSREYDERERARTVARFHHTEHHEALLGPDDVRRILPDIIEKMGEPLADPSVLPTYLVSQFASRTVKVVLTGDAGDELFMGYNKYLMDVYADRYLKLPGWVRRGICEPLVRALPDTKAITRKLQKVMANAGESAAGRRENLMSLGFKEEERRLLLRAPYFCGSIHPWLDVCVCGGELWH